MELHYISSPGSFLRSSLTLACVNAQDLTRCIFFFFPALSLPLQKQEKEKNARCALCFSATSNQRVYGLSQQDTRIKNDVYFYSCKLGGKQKFSFFSCSNCFEQSWNMFICMKIKFLYINRGFFLVSELLTYFLNYFSRVSLINNGRFKYSLF